MAWFKGLFTSKERFSGETFARLRQGKDSLLLNSMYLFGILIASSAFGFAVWVVASRFYTPEDVGVATVVISTSQLLTGLAGLGLGMGLIKFLPVCETPVRMVNTALLFTVVAVLAASMVYVLGTPLWSPALAFLTDRWDYWLGFALCGAVFGANSLVMMVFQALRHSKFGFWSVMITNVLRLLLTVVLARWGTMGIILAVVAAMLPSVLIGLTVFLPRVLPDYHFKLVWQQAHLKRLIPFSFGVHVALQVYQAPLLLTPLLVLERLGAAYSANAYIAWMLGALISSAGQAIAGSAYAEGSHALHNFAAVMQRSLRLSFLTTCIFALVLGWGAPWVLTLFGPAYQQAVPLLGWMALAAPLVSLNRVFFTGLQIRQALKKLIFLSVLSTFVFLTVFWLQVEAWGLNTVGIGWLMSQAVVGGIAFGDHRQQRGAA